MAIAFTGVTPVKLLFVSSIVAGIATPLTLLLMMVVAQNRRIMKHGQVRWDEQLGESKHVNYILHRFSFCSERNVS